MVCSRLVTIWCPVSIGAAVQAEDARAAVLLYRKFSQAWEADLRSKVPAKHHAAPVAVKTEDFAAGAGAASEPRKKLKAVHDA